MSSSRDVWAKLAPDDEARVQRALTKHGDTIVQAMDVYQGRTPLDALIEKEELEGVPAEEVLAAASAREWELRWEGYRAAVEDMGLDGIHPLKIARRWLAVAKICRLAPAAALSNTALGEIGLDGTPGRGRAAVGARIARIFNDRLRQAGVEHPQLSFQKGQETRDKLSAALEGNTNRKG